MKIKANNSAFICFLMIAALFSACSKSNNKLKTASDLSPPVAAQENTKNIKDDIKESDVKMVSIPELGNGLKPDVEFVYWNMRIYQNAGLIDGTTPELEAVENTEVTNLYSISGNTLDNTLALKMQDGHCYKFDFVIGQVKIDSKNYIPLPYCSETAEENIADAIPENSQPGYALAYGTKVKIGDYGDEPFYWLVDLGFEYTIDIVPLLPDSSAWKGKKLWLEYIGGHQSAPLGRTEESIQCSSDGK